MKLTEKIHLLQIDFEIAVSPVKRIPRFVNILLVFGEKITLVDTGVKGCEDLIFNYIKRNDRDYKEIEKIILSHSHPDHIGSAARIKEVTGCRVMCHRAEREWIQNIDEQNNERPVPGFFDLVDTGVPVDEIVSDGQEFTAGEALTIKFIHSPGHSKGSLNLLFREDRILFTADSIPLKNDIPNYDNYFDLLYSLEKIGKNRDFDTLLTSWTPPVNDKKEITRLITEGEEYLRNIDQAVKTFYYCKNKPDFDACRYTLEKLGLPPYLVNPLVDKTFRSHLE